jgi:ABC-type phosphate transport system substrate-binding protein
MKLFLPLLLAALAPTSSAQQVISVHGSGTTNPQKCYWDIMDKLTMQSKQPIRLTYRGIGSSGGQFEFIGDETTLQPFNDFGSGDIPLSEEDFNKFPTGSILHLPIVMGAISFFHSVPTNGEDLNLTPCVLAKILNRDITDWTDAEIITLNPDLNLPSPYPIKVAHRVEGSSSTASITDYLNQVCPTQWPANLVGKVITWKTDTVGCEGSGGMTDCIRETPGTIGYIDSGHGHAEGLQEIDLMNFDGEYLSSKKAAERNGILAAATGSAGIPAELDQSFASLNLLNQVSVIFCALPPCRHKSRLTFFRFLLLFFSRPVPVPGLL